MKEGKIRITLLSDLCVSDGGVYNSALDTDICQDEYGFPYIPAKRIRGCLREAAIELNNWKADIDPDALFGKEGNDMSKMWIGNAYPEDYEKMLNAVKGVNNRVYHKQNILNHFSYIRTQTAINYETGVADETSLRTMRVANKGLVFEAPVQYDESYEKQFVRCANILRHIGIARTRGLGEVEVKLVDEQMPYFKDEKHADYLEGSTRLDYSINLIDPVVFKSINGGEANTHDYIEGSRTLGIIAEYLKSRGRDYNSFMELGTLHVSHAYVSLNGNRYTETPASFYSVKNNDAEYRDKLYDNKQHQEEDRKYQLNPMKHGYVFFNHQTGQLDVVNVDVEERYHHRRPADKSIGRADTRDKDSVFYQISSICSGQKFKGFITGSPEQIKTVYDCFTSQKEFRMGAGRSSEYGRVSVHVDYLSEISPDRSIETSRFAVKLVSPAIVYNEKAFYSVDSRDLIDEISQLFKFDKNQAAVRKYIKYTTLGGWNVTWGCRKPTVQAFDKGSILVFSFDKAQTVILPGRLVIGERRIEGFGEVEFIEIQEDDRYYGILKQENQFSAEDSIDAGATDFAKAITEDLFLKFMRSEASEKAAEYFTEKSSNKKATVSDLTLMLKEIGTSTSGSVIAEIKLEAEDRYDANDERKKEKKKIADDILRKASECCRNMPDRFMQAYNITNFTYDGNKLESEFLLAYLTFGKYIMHKNDVRLKREEGAANE